MASPMRRAERPASGRRTVLRALACAPAAWLLTVGQRSVSAANPPAATFIDTLGKRVLEVLRAAELDRPTRLERLARLLDEATDLDLVARLVLGRYWRQATPAQRREYVELFRSMVLKTMADRLESYGGETYEIVGSQPVDDRDTIVSTRIVRPAAGTAIAVDWRVRTESGRLLLIDIIAEGVSMVVTQRSEVAEIAGRSGIDGLLAEMRQRLGRSA